MSDNGMASSVPASGVVDGTKSKKTFTNEEIRQATLQEAFR